MKLDDFLAKCPSCGTKLVLDEMGTDRCPKCWAKFRKKDDYDGMADLSIRIMDEIDTKVLILPKNKLAELEKIILSCSDNAVQKTNGSET